MGFEMEFDGQSQRLRIDGDEVRPRKVQRMKLGSPEVGPNIARAGDFRRMATDRERVGTV
jgi:hypothetical protein